MPVAFSSAGTNVPQRVAFNSGTLDFGTQRLVDVDNLSLDISGNVTPLYILGSILAQDLCRSNLKFTLTGKIKSFSPEVMSAFAGSSTVGTPMGIEFLDGQPTLQSPILTIYDRNAKQIQYQFTGAVFKSNKMSLAQEAYAEWDFELEAKLLTEVVYTA